MKKSVNNQTQSTNSAHTKLWISVICILLSISFAAVIYLGTVLYASNNKIIALQAGLNRANEKVTTLNTEQTAAQSEIGALKSALALTNGDVERLLAECEQLKEDLIQSQKEQALAEERLEAAERANQSAKQELDQMKDDMERLETEITDLEAELADLREQVTDPVEKIRIYIDQGHNPAPNHNSGASGNGLREEDLTFLIGTLLAELLENDNRFEVQLSRPDESVVLGTDNKSSLMARVEGAAAFEADYLISLHINSFTQDTASGIEVFAAESGTESYVFGESLLNGMVDATNLRNRGMKLNGDLDILEFSEMPAVLLEMGFISNKGDATLLSEHPELFARGIYNGMLEYFGLQPNTPAAT